MNKFPMLYVLDIYVYTVENIHNIQYSLKESFRVHESILQRVK